MLLSNTTVRSIVASVDSFAFLLFEEPEAELPPLAKSASAPPIVSCGSDGSLGDCDAVDLNGDPEFMGNPEFMGANPVQSLPRPADGGESTELGQLRPLSGGSDGSVVADDDDDDSPFRLRGKNSGDDGTELAIGIVNWNTEPLPTSDSAQIRPPARRIDATASE